MKPEKEAQIIQRIAERVFAFATKMIFDANHRDDEMEGDPKVGGHPAACSSCVHIMSALHFGVRQPQDLFAVKPHASPNDHSINYLLELFHEVPMRHEWMNAERSKAVMHKLRSFSQGGEPVFQSYHSEWDPDGYYYFPSGSVGIPPVVSMYTSLAYRYAEDHHFEGPKEPWFWSLVGDSEFREGSLMEAMPDAAERELHNVVWIVDYNRQNLDGTRMPNPRGLRGTDGDRMERVALANGWRVLQVRHGRKRLEVFERRGGTALKDVLENGFSDYGLQMLLLSKSGAVVREQLLAQDKKLEKLLAGLEDEKLFEVFADLGGHDVFELIRAMREAKRSSHDPTLIIAHTTKGWGLDCFASPGNHSALPEEDEVDRILAKEGLSKEDPYQRFEPSSEEGRFLASRRDELRRGVEEIWSLADKNSAFFAAEAERVGGIPETLDINLKYLPLVHTQYVWGQLAAKLIRVGNRQEKDRRGDPQRSFSEQEQRWGPPAELVLTMAPDVGTSTNINPAMDERIYGPEAERDWQTELGLEDRRRPKLAPKEDAWTRHIRFEIAEANCMSAAGAFGKMSHRLGVPFLPVMTVYDFFIKRAFDQLYYNLYWASGFIVVGTPSGVTLSPEGAQHSWKSDIQMPNLITWEPFFAIEVDWILADAVRRHYLGDNANRTGVLIRAVTRAFQQAEMLKRLRTAKRFESLPEEEVLEITRKDALRGAYYLVDYRGYEGYEPGENVVQIFTMGAMGSEALAASDRLRADGIYANVIVVTSGDLLCGNLADADDYRHLREGLGVDGELHLRAVSDRADLVTLAGKRVPLVCVVDGEPGLLDNLGSVVGVRCETLAVRKASKSGRPVDVYAYLHLDGDSVYEACGKVLSETALENVVVPRHLLADARPASVDRSELWPPRR